VRSGIHLIKFWFSVSRKEQRRRFKEREAHPLKQWKLSPIDMASLDKWEDYTKAKEAMFFATDTADSPWTVIKSDCKKRARLNAMRYVLHKLPYTNKDLEAIGPVDPLLVGRAHVVYEPSGSVHCRLPPHTRRSCRSAAPPALTAQQRGRRRRPFFATFSRAPPLYRQGFRLTDHQPWPACAFNSSSLATSVRSNSTIAAGECVCIEGASGSGKTLLLRAIADLDPHRGEVLARCTPLLEPAGPAWRRSVALLVMAESQWWSERIGDHFADGCRCGVDGPARPARGRARLASCPLLDRRKAAPGLVANADAGAGRTAARRTDRQPRPGQYPPRRSLARRLSPAAAGGAAVGQPRRRPDRARRAAPLLLDNGRLQEENRPSGRRRGEAAGAMNVIALSLRPRPRDRCAPDPGPRRAVAAPADRRRTSTADVGCAQHQCSCF
jgi:energy-coupling factor transporter ATP-binding protein EcfA2